VRDQLDVEHAARQADAARPSFSGALAVTALASSQTSSERRARERAFLKAGGDGWLPLALASGWLRARRSSFASLTR
jgi:hypothetical protein